MVDSSVQFLDVMMNPVARGACFLLPCFPRWLPFSSFGAPAGEIAQAVHTRGMRNHTLFLVANRRADAVGTFFVSIHVLSCSNVCMDECAQVDFVYTSIRVILSRYDRVSACDILLLLHL